MHTAELTDSRRVLWRFSGFHTALLQHIIL